MQKKIIIQYFRRISSASYLWISKTAFLFFCLCFSINFPAYTADERPEVIEKIRVFLRVEAKKPRQKTDTARKTGVSLSILDGFISSSPNKTQKKSLEKILTSFKQNYSNEYAKFTSSIQSFDQQSSLSVVTALKKSEPSQEYPCLNICDLPFNKSFPDAYTLFMVDSALIPVSSITSWDQHPNVKNIGSRFLRLDIAENKDMSFAITEQDAKEKNQWISQCEKIIPGSQEEKYYIIQLFKKRKEQENGAAFFIKSLTERLITPLNGFEFQAALIIFPYLEQKAMVYGLGCWKTLLNPDCTISQWGLRLATSGQICNPSRIKTISAAHYRAANPFSRREKAAALQPIETFGMEVGTEELETIALMPNKSVKTHHVIEASDYLQFTVNPTEQATLEQTLQSLNTISTYFFTLTTLPTFHIHSRMREFIDDEIKDESLITALNGRLEALFKLNGSSTFMLHDSLWREMNNKKLSFGPNKKHSIFEALFPTSSEVSLPKKIAVWTPKRIEPKEFDVLKIFYSLPFEYEEKFYRFDRNHWYQVDPSRFEGIKRILRKTKQDSNALRLPLYSVKDTERSTEQKKADYKEAKYNIRAVQTINQELGYTAILLDRLNISLEGVGHKFEFADLLVIHNNILHIVHVKRDGASALSHHREQVERSADFLATKLTKENAHELLLKGLINGLYQENGLSITKDKKQGKKITKGNIFLDHYNSLDSKVNLSSNLEAISPPIQNQEIRNFIQQVLKLLDKEFFKKYPEELTSALDALWDCVNHKQAHLSDMTIDNFLKAMKQAIEVREILFSNGILKKDDLKKIKLVLAVIDDHDVDATLKGKKKNNQRAIFKNQDLWGLDRTRMIVEKAGLGFTLMVINEHKTDIWDAFGSIVKKERKERFFDLSGDEPESFIPYSIKPAPFSQFVNLPLNPSREKLEMLFEKTAISSGILDVNTIQKLKYVFPEGKQTWEFLVCPTIGDGNCFFHAAYTDMGDTALDVQNKAVDMRKELCDVIQGGKYLDHLRPLVYEHYSELLENNSSHPEVPQSIQTIMIEKNEYTLMYNSMQKFGLVTQAIPNPETKYPINRIQELILPDHIKAYMERFRTVGGYETYIPVRPNMISPVDILAELGKTKINIFTFNAERNQLDFIKTAGIEGSVINILHTGNHFIRLYDSKDNKGMNQCEQILKNYYGY